MDQCLLHWAAIIAWCVSFEEECEVERERRKRRRIELSTNGCKSYLIRPLEQYLALFELTQTLLLYGSMHTLISILLRQRLLETCMAVPFPFYWDCKVVMLNHLTNGYLKNQLFETIVWYISGFETLILASERFSKSKE